MAQFCCNNGREILSLMQLGASSGVGFDIAENIIKQAEKTAQKAGVNNCKFVLCNILDIPKEYNNSFDFIMFTIGAITWFEDLVSIFRKVSDILNSIIQCQMSVTKMNEFNYDIGLTEVYNGRGYPLSYILMAQK